VEKTLNIAGNATLTSDKSMPALIVREDAITRNTNVKLLTVNGLAWVGGSFKNGTGSKGNLNFNGAVLFGGAGSVDPLYSGTVTVTQDRSRIGSMIMDNSVPTPSVTFLQYAN
jgi:hypothetical protein